MKGYSAPNSRALPNLPWLGLPLDKFGVNYAATSRRKRTINVVTSYRFPVLTGDQHASDGKHYSLNLIVTTHANKNESKRPFCLSMKLLVPLLRSRSMTLLRPGGESCWTGVARTGSGQVCVATPRPRPRGASSGRRGPRWSTKCPRSSWKDRRNRRPTPTRRLRWVAQTREEWQTFRTSTLKRKNDRNDILL